MIYFKPQLFEYNNGKDEVLIGVVPIEQYCGPYQVVFQPVKKLIFGICIAYGNSFRTFDACLKTL